MIISRHSLLQRIATQMLGLMGCWVAAGVAGAGRGCCHTAALLLMPINELQTACSNIACSIRDMKRVHCMAEQLLCWSGLLGSALLRSRLGAFVGPGHACCHTATILLMPISELQTAPTLHARSVTWRECSAWQNSCCAAAGSWAVPYCKAGWGLLGPYCCHIAVAVALGCQAKVCGCVLAV